MEGRLAQTWAPVGERAGAWWPRGAPQGIGGLRGLLGSRCAPGHDARAGTRPQGCSGPEFGSRRAPAPFLGRGRGSARMDRENAPGAEREGGAPILPSCSGNPGSWRQACPMGLPRPPPSQVEKGPFPPWRVGRGSAPAAVPLRALPCVSVMAPALVPVQVQWTGTRSDGKTEPPVCGYRRGARLNRHPTEVCGRGNSINRNV